MFVFDSRTQQTARIAPFLLLGNFHVRSGRVIKRNSIHYFFPDNSKKEKDTVRQLRFQFGSAERQLNYTVARAKEKGF